MIDKLVKLESEGYLRSQTHNNLPLTIWNYSRNTEYEDYWNEITLKCRGLVTDDNGNVINNCIPKFFNHSQQRGKYDCDFKNSFTITKKMDGSLIQAFLYDNVLIVTSKGSFHSDQSKWAYDILMKNYGHIKWVEGYTYIFELIKPENRIVCDYGSTEDLILLAVRDKDGDISLDQFSGFNCVEAVQLDIKKYKDLKDLQIPDDEEGYVVRFENGNRVKIKGNEYVRLHRIVTNTTNFDIWQALKDNLNMSEMTDRVPDEFLDWFYQTVDRLFLNYRKVENEIAAEWGHGELLGEFIIMGDGSVRCDDRKSAADYINTCVYKSELFMKLDGKSYNHLIWDRIKPEFEKAKF